MPNTPLTIALVFAAVLGTAITWLAAFYLHRWLRIQCHKLLHWIHIFLSSVIHTTGSTAEEEDYGHEQARAANTLTSSSWSTRCEGEGGTRERERKKRRRTSPRERMRGRVREWSVGINEESDGRPVPREENCWREIGWEARERMSSEDFCVDPGLTMLPEAVRSVVPAMPPPLALPKPIATSPQVAFEPPHSQLYVEDYDPEQSPYDTETTITLPPLLPPGRIDYIHICDEYPPMVLEALKQQHRPAFSDSSSSSSSSSTTHSIPLSYIPRVAFQFPQYPHLQNRLWRAAPTSHPRQWMDQYRGPGEAGTEPFRYAPYARVGDKFKLRGPDRRRLAPSNAPP
jgi:hypothetical protein